MNTDTKIEQRTVIKFLTKLGKTNAEMKDMLSQVYGEDTLSRSTLYEWSGRFREGREAVNDDAREGRPKTARAPLVATKIKSTINEDRRQTLRDVASKINISHESVRTVLKEDFRMNKVSPKMVLRVLTDDQKALRKQLCEDWLEAEKAEGILSRIITGDESWVYEHDIEKKRSSLVWLAPDEPRVKKARRSKSKIKAMLILFFDCRGILLQEWLPAGKTVTGAFYITILQKLRERIRKKRPDLWENNSWILHHDNAPAHSCLAVKQFLACNGTTVLEHPPYSPDLAPCDFFMFDRLKEPMRGDHLGSLERIKAESARILRCFSETDFQKCYQSWERRWRRCIVSQGEYFEGDKIVLP